LPPEQPRFLLDENFSHWLSELLSRFDYEVQQVQRVPDLGRPHPKVAGLRAGASDEEIAGWCARNGRAVVACDQDFRSHELRLSA
jgi:predicted nuclease of predicted toxin-antitoxin system